MTRKPRSTIVQRLGALALAAIGFCPQVALSDSTPFIGEVQAFGENFCPRGWAPANGALVSIASNPAMFSILGTTYGGDGRNTFGLPNLNMRSALNTGTGPGLPNVAPGAQVGTDQIQLTPQTMPNHHHGFMATNEAATKHGPGTDVLALAYDQNGNQLNLYHEGPANRVMHDDMIGDSGGGQPLAKRSPYQVILWCIATQGIFPSRN